MGRLKHNWATQPGHGCSILKGIDSCSSSATETDPGCSRRGHASEGIGSKDPDNDAKDSGDDDAWNHDNDTVADDVVPWEVITTGVRQ